MCFGTEDNYSFICPNTSANCQWFYGNQWSRIQINKEIEHLCVVPLLQHSNPYYKYSWKRWYHRQKSFYHPSKHLALCDRPQTTTRADQTACQQFAATNKHGCMYRWWPLLGQSLRPIDKWGSWVINHTNWNLIKRIWLWRVIFQNGTDLAIWRIAEELSFRVFHCAWNRAIHQAGHPQFRDTQLPF